MKKLLLILLFPLFTFSQEGISFSVYQDAKLASVGDNRGNEAFTLNIRIKNEWQGKQLKNSYFFVAPEFEFAQLQEDYYRYSANVGQRFNQFSKLIEMSYSIGYGLIFRQNISSKSFGADTEISININNKISLLLNTQLIHRTDWNVIRLSGFIGVNYKL